LVLIPDWSNFWSLEFKDPALEDRYQVQSRLRCAQAHKVLAKTLLVSALLFFIGERSEQALVFRVNNIVSWLYVYVLSKITSRFPSVQRHYGVLSLIWGLHYVLYQSLTYARAVEICRLMGFISDSSASSSRRMVMDDEGYQLLFNAVAIAALAMYARMPLRLFVTFSVAAPAIYACELLCLGTFLNRSRAIKHVIVYSLFCVLASLGAYQAEWDLRHIFRHDCELAEELAREREWHRCFGRTLASNFDYSTSLGPDLTLEGDKRLNAMLGTVIPESVHIFDLGHDETEKQRIVKFFDSLCEQVKGAPNICHGPERFSFTMGIDTAVEVDLQVLWVPRKAQVHTGDGGAKPIEIKACNAWPAGNLWVCFRQRQLEEMRFHGGAKPHTPQQGAGLGEVCDDVQSVTRYPDFTVDFEAGSPRFTMLNTSPGSPFENAMRQVPDLMDWLPMKYSEQFIEWVEESVMNAPSDAASMSVSFGSFVLQPPCSDWHALRVQRAILEIPLYELDEGQDLPVTMRLMGVSRRPRSSRSRHKAFGGRCRKRTLRGVAVGAFAEIDEANAEMEDSLDSATSTCTDSIASSEVY